MHHDKAIRIKVGKDCSSFVHLPGSIIKLLVLTRFKWFNMFTVVVLNTDSWLQRLCFMVIRLSFCRMFKIEVHPNMKCFSKIINIIEARIVLYNIVAWWSSVFFSFFCGKRDFKTSVFWQASALIWLFWHFEWYYGTTWQVESRLPPVPLRWNDYFPSDITVRVRESLC